MAKISELIKLDLEREIRMAEKRLVYLKNELKKHLKLNGEVEK